MNTSNKRHTRLKAIGYLAGLFLIITLIYYACSRHPQVQEAPPANGPVSGTELRLTATQIRLAGIRTDTVREENTGAEKILTGTVTTDETRTEELSARTAGRIQHLFVRTTGEKITAGQPVYSVYSEELMEAEKEYLLARQQQSLLQNPDVDYKRLIAAAENKLQLWGLSNAQIRKLAISGKVSAEVTVLSKVSGTVSDIAVHEGDYVTEGMSILKTQALNNLWVEAQLYANEAGNYKENDRVSVSFPDLGSEVINGKVGFINPELSDASKVDLIRVSIPNPQGLIRPGMLAYIAVAGENKRNLAVPVSAILTDGEGSKVWVKNADDSFSPRTIRLAGGNQSYAQVISGLQKGEVVIVNGVYLLNSELIFRNGTDRINPISP